MRYEIRVAKRKNKSVNPDPVNAHELTLSHHSATKNGNTQRPVRGVWRERHRSNELVGMQRWGKFEKMILDLFFCDGGVAAPMVGASPKRDRSRTLKNTQDFRTIALFNSYAELDQGINRV